MTRSRHSHVTMSHSHPLKACCTPTVHCPLSRMKITIPSRLTAPPISVSTSPAVPGASNAGIIITAADQPQPQQGDGTSLGDARNSSMSTSTSTSTSLHLGKRKRASNAPASASEMDLVESNQAAAPTTSKGGRTLAAQLYETMRDYTRE